MQDSRGRLGSRSRSRASSKHGRKLASRPSSQASSRTKSKKRSRSKRREIFLELLGSDDDDSLSSGMLYCISRFFFVFF